MCNIICYRIYFFFSSRRRHTRCALVTGVQTCALPIFDARGLYLRPLKFFSLFHPPLHIGWDAIANLEPRKTLWIQVYHISFRRDVPMLTFGGREIGRAPCRERVCQYV